MESFADIRDVEELYRELEGDEEERAEALLPVISDRLRLEAEKVGRDLDKMIEDSPSLKNVARSVCVDILARTLMTPTGSQLAPMSQFSQSAGGYSVSGTFLNPGGGLFIKRSELSALGIKRQRYGVLEVYEDADTGYKRPSL